MFNKVAIKFSNVSVYIDRKMDPVKVEYEATCVCFHPSKSLLAAGNIEGHLKM